LEKSNRFNKLITLCDLGVGGERGIVYSPDGICTAQSATQYKDAIKVLEIIRLDENGNECECNARAILDIDF